MSPTASSNPVILDYLKARRTWFQTPNHFMWRLNAIRWGIDKDFPELNSPASCISTPRASPISPESQAKPLYSQVVWTPSCSPPPAAHSAAPPTLPQEQQKVVAQVLFLMRRKLPRLVKIVLWTLWLLKFISSWNLLKSIVGLHPDGKNLPRLRIAKRGSLKSRGPFLLISLPASPPSRALNLLLTLIVH